MINNPATDLNHKKRIIKSNIFGKITANPRLILRLKKIKTSVHDEKITA